MGYLVYIHKMLVLLALLNSLLFNVGMAADSRFSLGAYFKNVADLDNQGITVANLIQENVNQLANGGNKIQNKKAGVTQGIEGKCSTFCHDKLMLPKFENLIVPQNIALNKPTTQSSTQTWKEISFVSSFANDGNTNGDFRVCARTKKVEAPRWWLVDLKNAALVLAVTVKSGSTWGEDKINPFDIRVGHNNAKGIFQNPFCARNVTLPIRQTKIFLCPAAMYGQYVSIHIDREEPLQLCEVEVYGIE